MISNSYIILKDERPTSNNDVARLFKLFLIGRIPYSKFDVGRSMFDVHSVLDIGLQFAGILILLKPLAHKYRDNILSCINMLYPDLNKILGL